MASTSNTQTHVRVSGTAPKRISKLAKKLAATRGGSWKSPAVVDEALKTLEESEAAKSKASEPAEGISIAPPPNASGPTVHQ